jgi:LysM repeat protein
MQKEFEQMAEDNRRLREDNDRLHAQLANRSPQIPTNPPAATRIGEGLNPASGNSTRPTAINAGRPATAARTHVVKPGETPVAIAKQYGIKLDDLLRANPGLDPKRMRSGKTLNIPPG